MIELENIEDITYDYMTRTMVILLKEPVLHEKFMRKELSFKCGEETFAKKSEGWIKRINERDNRA